MPQKKRKKRYQGRTFCRESIYICGDYMDGDVYPVFQPPGKRRKRCRPSSAIQARLNQSNAAKKLTRLVHLNFTRDDLALHLTYDDAPADEKQATKDLQNFLRRLKRKYAKVSAELKYITCTEYGTRSGRVHHHLIINSAIDRDEVERLWGHGYANSKRLQFRDDGVTGLAHYMSKSHTFYRRWNSSRNLIRPEAIVSDGDYTLDDAAELARDAEDGIAHAEIEKRYPDFICTDIYAVKNPINGGFYIHFEMRRRREYEYRL